jgi:flagellar assembly protein FliH
MSSSKNIKFTETELLSLNTWTSLEDFGLQRSESVEPSEATRTLTVEEIEAMQQQAYDEAFLQGKQDGFLQGKEEGFAEGEKQGLEQGRTQGYEENLHLLQKQATELALLMETLHEPFKLLDETVEKELLQLTITMVSHVVRREIKMDPGQIIGVIREALKVLPIASQKVSLTLHPDDAELVKKALRLEEHLPKWQLIEDPLLTRGGCQLNTETSHIDASIEKRIADVVASVLGDERQQDTVR